jgi:hypothetical protein
LQIASAVDVTPLHGQSIRADVWLHFGIVLITERSAIALTAEISHDRDHGAGDEESGIQILRRGQNLQRKCLSKEVESLR